MSHPSKSIIATESRLLGGKRIILGVTSSISLYRSLDLARKIMRNGADVTVVMSGEAALMVSPDLFEWATGNKVYHTRFGGETGHIYLAETHDAMVIAPTTLNTLSKIAGGIADTPVVLTALSFIGAGKPLMVVPAMHMQLYSTPQAREALEKLKDMGVYVHEGKIEDGKLKYPPIEHIEWHLESMLHSGEDLRGKRILVTGGPTREYLDDIRFLSNPSTGKMGLSLALEAAFRGAQVTYIHGPMCASELPAQVREIEVETTEEMLEKVLGEIESFKPHAIIMAAAPEDYKPSYKREGKLPSGEKLSLILEPTPKIIEEARRKADPETIIVGFSAEVAESMEDLRARALSKKKKYDLNIVVANNVGRKDIGFASDYNEAIVITEHQELVIKKSLKRAFARTLLDIVGDALLGKRTKG